MNGYAKERLQVMQDAQKLRERLEKLKADRECLSCEKIFKSASPQNRICNKCKGVKK